MSLREITVGLVAADVAGYSRPPGWAVMPGVDARIPLYGKVIGPLLQGAATIVRKALWPALVDLPGWRTPA